MSHKIVSNTIIFADVTRLIAEGRSVKIVVKGNSMRPFIFHGDSVELRAIASPLRVGDIVLAQHNEGSFVIHRVISIDNDCITLRGDGNSHFNEEVNRQDIIAQVVMIERKKHQAIDPRTTSQRRWAALWHTLFPIRRYLLFVGKHLCKWRVVEQKR